MAVAIINAFHSSVTFNELTPASEFSIRHTVQESMTNARHNGRTRRFGSACCSETPGLTDDTIYRKAKHLVGMVWGATPEPCPLIHVQTDTHRNLHGLWRHIPGSGPFSAL